MDNDSRCKVKVKTMEESCKRHEQVEGRTARVEVEPENLETQDTAGLKKCKPKSSPDQFVFTLHHTSYTYYKHLDSLDNYRKELC